jgi:hypothetical protein
MGEGTAMQLVRLPIYSSFLSFTLMIFAEVAGVVLDVSIYHIYFTLVYVVFFKFFFFF